MNFKNGATVISVSYRPQRKECILRVEVPDWYVVFFVCLFVCVCVLILLLGCFSSY